MLDSNPSQGRCTETEAETEPRQNSQEPKTSPTPRQTGGNEAGGLRKGGLRDRGHVEKVRRSGSECGSGRYPRGVKNRENEHKRERQESDPGIRSCERNEKIGSCRDGTS